MILVDYIPEMLTVMVLTYVFGAISVRLYEKNKEDG